MNGIQRNYYTWNDEPYRQFMSNLLRFLEPCRYQTYHNIIRELDEIGEITFIDQGTVGIGFEINKKAQFVIKHENKCVVGAFGITFGQRSQYIYKTFTRVQGYFIRKVNWMDILKEKPEISKILK